MNHKPKYGDMKREYLASVLLYFILAVFFYLFYRIIIPFFIPICWAAVFAIILFPIYERLQRRIESKSLCSLLMCLFVVVVIIGPIAYLFVALVNEAADAVTKVNEMFKSGRLQEIFSINLPWVEAAKERLSQYYDLSKVDLDQIAKDAMNHISRIIFDQTSWLIANGTKTVFYFILTIFTTYYFFKDGERIVARVKRLMPFPSVRVHDTFGQLRDVIQATMYGGVVVALVQGILGGILFALFGLSSPVFWGAIMAFLSVIPFLGAFVIYIPAGIILLLGGSIVKGLLVIAIGTIVISQIDNVIRPYLISGRTQMHPLMLFFSIMGGIALFGILGVVIGPLIAAVFVTLLRILQMHLHY